MLYIVSQAVSVMHACFSRTEMQYLITFNGFCAFMGLYGKNMILG